MIEIDALGGVRSARTQRRSSAPTEGALSHATLEFLLEGDEAHTALTLTHAGFAAGVNSNSIAVVRRGWEFELQSLRHYLEFHFGLPREVVWVKQMARDVAADIWDRIIPLLVVPATSEKWHQGNVIALISPRRDRPSGTLEIYDPPYQLVAAVTSYRDALLRIKLDERASGAVEINIWLSAWGVERSVLKRFQDYWNSVVEDIVFAAQPSNCNQTPQSRIAECAAKSSGLGEVA